MQNQARQSQSQGQRLRAVGQPVVRRRMHGIDRGERGGGQREVGPPEGPDQKQKEDDRGGPILDHQNGLVEKGLKPAEGEQQSQIHGLQGPYSHARTHQGHHARREAGLKRHGLEQRPIVVVKAHSPAVDAVGNDLEDQEDQDDAQQLRHGRIGSKRRPDRDGRRGGSRLLPCAGCSANSIPSHGGRLYNTPATRPWLKPEDFYCIISRSEPVAQW